MNQPRRQPDSKRRGMPQIVCDVLRAAQTAEVFETWIFSLSLLDFEPGAIAAPMLIGRMQEPRELGGLGLKRAAAYDRRRAMLGSGAWLAAGAGSDGAELLFVSLPADAVQPTGHDPPHANAAEQNSAAAEPPPASGFADEYRARLTARGVQPARELLSFEGSKAKEESKGKVDRRAPFKGSKGGCVSLKALLAQLDDVRDGQIARLEQRVRLRDWIKSYFEFHGDQTTHPAVCGRMADCVLDNGLPAKKVLAEAVDAIADAFAKGTLGNAGALATKVFRRNSYPLPRSPPDKPK